LSFSNGYANVATDAIAFDFSKRNSGGSTDVFRIYNNGDLYTPGSVEFRIPIYNLQMAGSSKSYISSDLPGIIVVIAQPINLDMPEFADTGMKVTIVRKSGNPVIRSKRAARDQIWYNGQWNYSYSFTTGPTQISLVYDSTGGWILMT
jgi:hypothetical protein